MASTDPYIPPSRWLKRRLKFLGILLVILCLIWGIWAWIAQREFQARIDGIVARHERVLPEDFDRPALADSENAAKLYAAAAAALVPGIDTPGMSDLQYQPYPPFPAEWHRLADASVAANANALAIVRKARGMPNADWGIKVTWPPNTFNFIALNPQRKLAVTVHDAAVHAHLHGDDAEAIERVRDSVAQASAIYSDGSLVSYLVGIGIYSMTTQTIMAIAPDLYIEGSDTGISATGKPVSAQVVRELIRDLLDDSAQRSAELRSMEMERAFLILKYRFLCQQQFLLKPLWQVDVSGVLDRRGAEMRAAQSPDAISQRQVLNSYPKLPEPNSSFTFSVSIEPKPPRLSRAFSDHVGNLDQFLRVGWIAISARRTAAISLAMRLYRADHHDWPATLDVLVPKYLPAVPVDPYQSNGAPMRYTILRGVLPNGGDRPVLYFDPPGSTPTNPPPAHPCFEWENNKDGRQWRDLSLWIEPEPTTRP